MFDCKAEQFDAMVETLKEIREMCASNLNNPGNEDDTFDYVISSVTGVLGDDYVFVEEEYE